MAKKSTLSLEQQITQRFIQGMYDVTGPGKQFHFKRDFGRAMNMVSQEIHKMEKNIMPVQLRHLVYINKLTGISIHWIITGEGEKNSATTSGSSRLSALEKRVAALEKKK